MITTHNPELAHASEVLLNNKIEKLPVVDDEGRLVGLITYKDLTKVQDHPNACKDAKGRLRVAAGIGITPDAMERVKALVPRMSTPWCSTRRTATRATWSTRSGRSRPPIPRWMSWWATSPRPRRPVS